MNKTLDKEQLPILVITGHSEEYRRWVAEFEPILNSSTRNVMREEHLRGYRDNCIVLTGQYWKSPVVKDWERFMTLCKMMNLKVIENK